MIIIILDFRKNKKLPKKVIINNRNVEIVENFKYLGILFDNTFSFDLHVQTVFRKVAQRRHLVFQLGNFNIDKNIITLAYTAFVRSVIQYCLPIYFHFTKKKHQKKLCKLFNKYPSKTSIPLETSISNTCEGFVKKVNESPNHPLKCFLSILPSGRRFSIPFCRTSRLQKSVLLHCILVWNSTNKWLHAWFFCVVFIVCASKFTISLCVSINYLILSYLILNALIKSIKLILPQLEGCSFKFKNVIVNFYRTKFQNCFWKRCLIRCKNTHTVSPPCWHFTL